MKKLYLLFGSILTCSFLFGQYHVEFETAYRQNPFVPKGLLEAVAYTNTHIQNITAAQPESCSGMPLPYGVMGIFDNGKNYFRTNGLKIADLSGISVSAQKSSIALQINAYAKAVNQRMQELSQNNINNSIQPKLMRALLSEFSEIPTEGNVNQFALDAQIFEILRTMDNPDFTDARNLPRYYFNYAEIFGAVNAEILQSKKVQFGEQGIVNAQVPSQRYTYVKPAINGSTKSTEYGPAIWTATPSCNYSSRNGTAISAITIHTTQGSYAGAISWAQNCNSNVSYHYVIRSSDGQITQMVLEANKAWHVGSENPYTIGFEHEGYINESTWYTDALYTSSAALSRDITNSGYGISPLRTYYLNASTETNTLGNCTKIKGHQHFANQSHTDPGIYWNWEKYYKLINNALSITPLTALTGTHTDTGGTSANYSDDERKLWLIQPSGASSITLTFTAFNLENNYDHLFIYNGATTNSPLIGRYTGTSLPATINASSGSLLIEFRSDCATNNAGWSANWSAGTVTASAPTTSIPVDNAWKTTDFTVNFTDNAPSSTIQQRFYLAGTKAAGKTGWSARTPLGFLNEDFQDDRTNWTDQSDVWNIQAGSIKNTSATNTNTNIAVDVAQSIYSSYLYHWDQKITSSGTNQRAGLHFFCSDASLANRGNSYFVFFRESTNKVQLYKVTNNVFTLVKEDACTVNVGVQYDYKVYYNPSTGWMKVYVNDQFVSSWQDTAPLTSGSSVSLRTGDCIAEFDNVRMYRSRAASATITVNAMGMLNQNSVNGVRSGLVRSIIINANDVVSNETYQNYLVDYTTALAKKLNVLKPLNTSNSTVVNFEFEDLESDVTSVQLSAGRSIGQTDVLDWTDVSTLKSFELTSNLEEYTIQFKVVNGAGLSETFSIQSNQSSLETAAIQSDKKHIIFPNPSNQYIQIAGLAAPTSVTIIDVSGKTVQQLTATDLAPIDVAALANGIYQIYLQTAQGIEVHSFVKN